MAKSYGYKPGSAPGLESVFRLLPADVLLLILDHLDVPSVLSLSITCRDIYSISYSARQRKPSAEDLKEFMLLVERDPGTHGLYYCHPCKRLHTFKTSWGLHDANSEVDSCSYKCARLECFSPIGNPIRMNYTYARLAMNRHLHGPGHGIALQNLRVEHTAPRDFTTIHCSTDARILDDELFLQRRYSFSVKSADLAAFRKCKGARDFRLCQHTSFFANSSAHGQYVPELHRRPWLGGDAFVPCQDVPGSCGMCLMDYDISVSPAPNGTSWAVLIRAYHQLGHCRSPEDWKWARFTESNHALVGSTKTPTRRASTYYPGVVRSRWMESEHPASAQPTPPRDTRVVSSKLPSWYGPQMVPPLLAVS